MSAAQQARGSTARRLAGAARVVARVADEGRPLDEALQAESPIRLLRSRDGEADDRAAIQALAYGTIRWWPRLEKLSALLLERPAGLAPVVRALVGVALHQLEQSSHPVHAVVDESVHAVRLLRMPRATGLVNAVLRRFLREREALRARLANDLVAQHAHPLWLLDSLRTDWPGEWQAIAAENNRQPPMWLRVNRRRSSVAAYLESLRAAGIGASASEHAPDAIVLAQARDVSELPGFAEGLVSIQDCAAQLTAPFLDLRAGLRVLDACAAPGGKACQILEHADLELVALDCAAARLEAVRENLARLQLSATVLAGDATEPTQWWDRQPFDRILIDAPCSATGVIRRHPDIKLLRRPGDRRGRIGDRRGRIGDLEALAQRQLALLLGAWPLLAAGGRLLYATCSTSRTENHAVVAQFLARSPDAVAVPLPAAVGHVVPELPGLQILPGEAGMDGFYYACLERRRN